MIIATLEILSAGLFLMPRTRSIGLLLVSAYLGGAIATHMGHDEPVYQPAFVLVLFWMGAWLRHPEMFWSFNHRSAFRSSRFDGSKPMPVEAQIGSGGGPQRRAAHG